ncbi:Hypothetical protein Rta_24580 [Ramlibacter tataouinensis TTB310]|uniref:Uncharacterized protein n=1 Tax=Ramlibacter tataouinensis (strain ATCC BAA-407 / DSM 14655 / LMG 21543 / TTB310) TaxID=365046 RepID=F5Y1X2_RAMTT|nr:Hypothetical protein Rta_24580 [Ramlibacter tataouinensis TTB310]
MAPAITADSRRRAASTGSSTRTSAAAIAKAPSRLPMTEADRPRSCPSTGTTKVCTSQQDDSSQLTSSRRRKPVSRTRSQAVPGLLPAGATTGGSSRAPRTQNQVASGSTAIRKKAQRKPPWSITSPAANGPRKLETAGPIASQENTWRSRVASPAARPTCRCRAIEAAPVAPPVIRALAQSTG